VKVAGFRRFGQASTLNTTGKLVAILGPNEAGKSSLLDAIAMLSHDEAPARGDIARASRLSLNGVMVCVSLWRYRPLLLALILDPQFC
jgi:ABC-type sulfate/molybdate transport systems ATPase subunit